MPAGELTHEKLHFIYRSAMEDELKILLELLKSKLGPLHTRFMIGMSPSRKSERNYFKQALRGKKTLTVYQELRIRYGYCTVRLIIEEFGDNGLNSWFFRKNRTLNNCEPIKFLRCADPRDLFLVLRAAMVSIGAADGVYQ